MNEGHLQFCTSEAWRTVLEDTILPVALRRADLGPRVVEVGPAVGFTTEALLRICERVTAVEIDPELAARLRDRLAGRPVDVVVGDGRVTGLPAAAFTGAASFHMFHHIPTDADQDEVFAELRRLLEPGGALLVADGFDSEEVRRFHEGDTYNPVEPAAFLTRLQTVGFTAVTLRVAHNLIFTAWKDSET